VNDHVTLDNTEAAALVGRIADEFTDRLNRGENPQIEDYAAQYPEVATMALNETWEMPKPARWVIIGFSARWAVAAWALFTKRSRFRWAGAWP
jgi:hypothetical protein